LKVVASIAAPGTILTGLMFYLGLLYAIGYYRHFGVNYTVLELPVQDYLVLSANAAVIPLAVLAAATLVALWFYRLPVRQFSSSARSLIRWIVAPAVVVSGLALIGTAVADTAWGLPVYPMSFWEARGLSLASGVLIVAYGIRIHRLAGPQRQHPGDVAVVEAVAVGTYVALSVLVGIGLFWAVGSYGIGAGAGEAQGLAADLPCQSDVTLYSEKDLNLKVAGVVVETVADSDAAYRFRYSGLKLVPQSGAWYLFLPGGWRPGESPAILLPHSDTLRLEFVPVGYDARRSCSS
jgi:hypothetical protein